MPTEFTELDLDGLGKLAQQIASRLDARSVLTLSGDLGTGKTTFARLLIRHITGEATDVTSPTFNLVHNYPSPKGQVWHFDLYRLDRADEVYQLGIEDAFHHGISIIEWPELIEHLLPNDTIKLQLSFGKKGNTRNVILG